MIRKTKLIETLGAFQKNSSDHLVDRLIVIQKVDEAQKQSREGRRYSGEEAKNMIKKWSK